MLEKTLVSIPDGVKIYKRNNIEYIYHVIDKVYHKDKQYVTEKRECIGKKYDDTKMYPNQNYFKYYTSEIEYLDEAPEFDVSLSLGAMAVFDTTIKNLGIDFIIDSLDINNKSLCKDLLYYYTFGFDTTSQYYKDFAYDHFAYSKKIYSEGHISKFLSTISINEITKFLDLWNDKFDKESIYIDYDGTNMNTSSAKSELAEFGHAKVDEGLPQINLSYAINHKNGMPLFYELYPGSINDMTETKMMVDKAVKYGYSNKDITFIMDRGMCSSQNINYLEENGFKYIIMAKTNIDTIYNSIISSSNKLINNYETFIEEHNVYGITLERDIFKDKKTRYIHIYYDNTKADEEIRTIHLKIKQYEQYIIRAKESKIKASTLGTYKKYFSISTNKDDEIVSYKINNEVIKSETILCGFFTIITSDRLDCKYVLTEYRKRDIVEKAFRDLKTYLNLDKFKVQADSSINAKVFLTFISAIIKTNLRNRLASYIKDNRSESFKTILKIIEKIKAIKINGSYVRQYALTAKQRKILNELQIKEQELNAYLTVLNSN